MASCPITSRQIDGETMGTMTDFIFLGSKITEDGACMLSRFSRVRLCVTPWTVCRRRAPLPMGLPR